MEENKMDISEKEKKVIELELLERARAYWDEFYPRTDAEDLAKMRIYSKEGLVQGVIEHTVKHQWYAKQGYWEDGRTKLEDYERGLILKKLEFGKKISGLQASYIGQFEEIIERATVNKKKLEKIPSRIKEEYGIKRNELLSDFTLNLENLYDSYMKSLEEKTTEIYDEMLEDFERQKGVLVTQSQTDMRQLHQNSKGKIEGSIKKLGAELEAELSILDVKEKDDHLLKQYQEEIRKINQEINSLKVKPTIEEVVEPSIEKDVMESSEVDSDLNEFTIPALKQLADQKGIEYTRHIRKADLIELLEG